MVILAKMADMENPRPDAFVEKLFDFGTLMGTGRNPMPFVDGLLPGETPEQYTQRAATPNTIDREQAIQVGIERAFDNFEANQKRLVSLAHLPAEAFFYAVKFRKLAEEVNAGKLPREGEYLADDPPHSMFLSLSRALRDCIEGKRQFPVLSEDEYACYFQVSGMAALGNPQWIGPSIEAFSVSVLSQSWHTFEVLTEDLLGSAVSNNRDKFPEDFRTPVRIRGGLNGKEDGIRVQYKEAFVGSNEEIIGILSDEHLDYTYAIRNLFLHQSGRTSEAYRNAALALKLPKLIIPELDAPFPLTGQLTRSLGDHCLCCGMSLLYEVYIWIGNRKWQEGKT
jgi:hypothetical protein